MSVINTNITSMIGQSNLQKSQNALTTSMERLSSGLRINSAKDDAAGQAIANRMSAQITGLAQSQRNANDGISVAQTAEGALNQVNDNLQRIRELSVQAQNGTNSQDDLTSIQNEIGQRLNEINRISEETSFNGVKVLASDQGLKIQVGSNDGEAITVNLEEINAETLGLNGFNVDGSGTPNKAATLQNLLAEGFEETATPGEYTNTAFNGASSVEEVFANLKDGGLVTQTDATGATDSTVYKLDANSNTFSFDRAAVDVTDPTQAAADLGLTPGAGETNTVTVALGGVETKVNISSSGTLTNADTGENLYLTGTAGTKDLSVTSAGGSQATIDDLVTELAAIDGTTASGSITTSDGTVYKNSAGATANTIATENEKMDFDSLKNQVSADTTNAYKFDMDGDTTGTTGDQYIIKANNGAISGYDATAVTADAAIYTSGFVGDNSLLASATATVYVNDNGKITDGAANEVYANADGKLTFEETSGSTKTEDPLATLDAALNQVDSLRSDLGAIQNRFESAITNLQTNETNLSAARSRIEDADYATEVANMTRAQILQQAGTSVLAQANQIPQNVLSLLG
ncbi:flagellin [Vreelandella aquamarina]|jgi:flagellin|uniref:Flagellin n=1 Tax=Vreelandella aquamarina TaxID=77097 RepID=A0A1N6DKB4_9GAMM|nr:flagellin [Halomonas meridiana]GED47103.1 flagellin [Halomonas meridiana]SIN63297.1 flagellin [Halomonas meridiana]SIN71222.1 flagellin [Halomonas meridiana]SIO43724.1 flagellin [Halomonas meridiana]